jgi:hypothetical protein
MEVMLSSFSLAKLFDFGAVQTAPDAEALLRCALYCYDGGA